MPVLNWDPFFVPRTDPWRTGHLTFVEASKRVGGDGSNTNPVSRCSYIHIM